MSPVIDMTAEQRKTVLSLLSGHLPDTEAWVYGSRVRWTSRPESDLDLVVFASPEQARGVSDLREAFEESNLPFRVDLFVWDEVPESFRERIEQEHVVVLEKGNARTEPKGSIKPDRNETALGDLIDIVHGFAFKGKFIHDEPREDVLLTPGNFAIGGGFKADKFKYYSGIVPDDFVLSEGDLIVSMTDLSKLSDTLGYPAFVPECKGSRRYLHNQRLGKVTLQGTEVERKYIYYVMCGKDYRHEVLASATGTAVKHTSPDRIKQFRFQLPSLSEQRAIAHILGTLDDKIELNRRMNETLEAMARAIFKDWFVDFGPTRAKAALRPAKRTSSPSKVSDGTGKADWPAERARAYLDRMDPKIATLFPDRFVDSELGEIPEGWEVGVLDEAVELLSGGTPRTSIPDYWDGDIPWYTAKDAPALSEVFVLATERTITQSGIENSSARILPAGTTIITARGTVGRLACLGIPMAMNQTCYGIQGAGGYPAYFTYWSIRAILDQLQRQAHGTIFDTITRRTFQLVETALVPVDLAQSFEIMIRPVMARILENLNESRSLVALRDVLLPKLISDELRVKDADCVRVKN